MTKIDIDMRKVGGFLLAARLQQEKAVQSFLQRGAQFLEGEQRRGAARRFGVETSQSRMQTVDSKRPKGIWSGSVSSTVRQGQTATGPRVPYAWWVERGAEAPRGVPLRLAGARFRGHRVVERSLTENQDRLQAMWEKETRSAMWRSL